MGKALKDTVAKAMEGKGKGKSCGVMARAKVLPRRSQSLMPRQRKARMRSSTSFAPATKSMVAMGVLGNASRVSAPLHGAITVGPHFILSKTEGAQRNAPGPPGRLLRPQLQEAHCFTTTYWRMVNLQRKHRR